MTTPSESEKVEALVNSSLDCAVESLSYKQQQDLSKARKLAMAKSGDSLTIAEQETGQRWIDYLKSPQLLAPVSLAVCVVILVNYLPSNESFSPGVAQVQPLPLEALDASIPTEDLTLLQDLEFAQWLVDQETEQEVVL